MIFSLVLSLWIAAHAEVRPTTPAACGPMTTWDYTMGMCMPRAMAGMPMKMLMLNGNGFLAQTVTGGPRGTNALMAPHMLMVDLGTTLGSRHYLNLDLMGTFELWTLPKDGAPELTQIGERNAHGTAYRDAQHPHSSPIMGLTLSDTISYGEDPDHFKIWFSPRGQSTDGPIAFMHRPTGMMIPDAPLGHHVGQDVGHISSTVVGAQARRRQTTLQASSFHGREPEPWRVDLPLGRLDSYAARAIQEFGRRAYATASVAYVAAPEEHDPDLDHVWRYSASLYYEHPFAPDWIFRHTLIYGLTNFYDHAPALNSFGEEFWLKHRRANFWGRFEALERTPDELEIAEVARPHRGRYLFALTLGYTHDVWSRDDLVCSIGGGVTETFLPHAYQSAYGEAAPWSARVFLQLSGMKMWHL